MTLDESLQPNNVAVDDPYYPYHMPVSAAKQKKRGGEVKTYGVVPERYSDDDIEHH